MRARKIFCVVAYDIVDDKRRESFSRFRAKYGRRGNLSVYGCLFTDGQYEKIREMTAKLTDRNADTVIYYPLCVNCYTKIEYFHKPHKKAISSVDVF